MRRWVDSPLVLVNGSHAWLRPHYALTYDLIPFEHAYTRPMARSPYLTMLAYSPVSPVPTALSVHSQVSEYEAGAAQRLGCVASAPVCAYLRSHHRSNAPMLAPWPDLLVSRRSRTHLSHLCPARPFPVHAQVGVDSSLMLVNSFAGWLQLRYAHIYSRAPLKRAYARPMSRSRCLTMLAY